ncbi:hypothetical protein O3M35_001088 [Rhynocoris fuscipes]|uniref:CHK kinase-like domain-containing protein n=1 Tax=Rhynocoris fuscipes TaxID=488301 RepID=A0AAW1DR16_9HEMI
MEESAWLETILKRNCDDSSISKVLSIKTESAVPAGANYTSIITRATLDVILRSGRKSKLTLIIKRAHDSEEKVKFLNNFSVFKNEAKFYSDVLVKFEQFMDDYNDNREKLWCNMIGYKPYTAIVFEDLKAQNFKMADRKKLLDRNHALLVLNGLGRFHAMGHVLLKQGLVSKEDLMTPPYDMESPVMSNLFESGLKQLCNVIENDWPDEWNDVATRLKAQVDVVTKKVKDLCKSAESKFQTICHGDVWTCNLMFKYCPYDEKVPVALKFLDFQGPFVSANTLDILNFIYTSILNEVRKRNYDELLAEYHKSLKSTLTHYGMEADSPTLDEIHSEMKRLKYYGFIMNIIFLPICVADDNMGMKIENLNEGCDGMAAYPPGMFNGDIFKAAVQPEIRNYLEEGLF